MFILACEAINANIPSALMSVVSTVVTIIQIGVPIVLIVLGMLDLFKAVISQKEEDIKKNQQLFLKRLLAAAIVFFIVFIVQLLVSLVSGATGDDESVWSCIECFVNYDDGNCQ